jgi:hypothetical protein
MSETHLHIQLPHGFTGKVRPTPDGGFVIESATAAEAAEATEFAAPAPRLPHDIETKLRAFEQTEPLTRVREIVTTLAERGWTVHPPSGPQGPLRLRYHGDSEVAVLYTNSAKIDSRQPRMHELVSRQPGAIRAGISGGNPVTAFYFNWPGGVEKALNAAIALEEHVNAKHNGGLSSVG